MQDGKFRHFIIITIMMPFEHDSVIRRENALGDLAEGTLIEPIQALT